MLKVTVQAIHGQAGPAGSPNPAITPMLGNAAPTTSAATAAFASRRDFTHAFHAACRNALASMARKTVRGKGAGSGTSPLKARFAQAGNRGRRIPACAQGAPVGQKKTKCSAWRFDRVTFWSVMTSLAVQVITTFAPIWLATAITAA